ncbi:MAG: FIG00003370: Multicopper polyphenol oxidase, partial [uncultured Solirubrobacterales bacterium]
EPSRADRARSPGRSGRLLDPPRGRERRPLPLAQPRDPDRRRARASGREPPPPRHPRRARSRLGGDGLAGPRGGARRVDRAPGIRRPARPGCSARPGRRPSHRPFRPRPPRPRSRLHAGGPSGAGTRGHAALRLARSGRGHRRGGGRPLRRAAGGGPRTGDRALLLRGRARGAGGVRGARRRRRGPHARHPRGRASQARGGGSEADRGRRPVHELPRGPLLLSPPRRRRDRAPGRDGVAHRM